MTKKISVLLPTIGRGSIVNTITGLLPVEEVSEFVILDSGEESIIIKEEIQILFDLCSRLGKPVRYLRDYCSIGKARAMLIQVAIEDLVLMIDDDVYIDKYSVLRLCETLALKDIDYAVPCNYIVTNYLGVKDLDRRAMDLIEIQRIVGDRDWMYPYFRYKNNEIVVLASCGTQCLLIKKKHINPDIIKKLERWKQGYPREDILLTSSMRGALCTYAESWHLQTTKKRVEWAAKDTELGYREVIEGRLNYFLEQIHESAR